MMVKSKSIVVVALHSMGKIEMQGNKDAGVGFAVQMNLVSHIGKLPHGFSNRLYNILVTPNQCLCTYTYFI